MTRSELLAYVREFYSVEADYPWKDENYVLRHENNRKWFAVGLTVPYARLHIDREGSADILDVNSTLETSPGVKSTTLLRELVAGLVRHPTCVMRISPPS